MTITQWINECHTLARNKGFHDKKREFGTSLMLIVSELGEALEGHRNNDWDNVREEIADVFIRLFDLCGEYYIDAETEIENKHIKNKERPPKHNKEY